MKLEHSETDIYAYSNMVTCKFKTAADFSNQMAPDIVLYRDKFNWIGSSYLNNYDLLPHTVMLSTGQLLI